MDRFQKFGDSKLDAGLYLRFVGDRWGMGGRVTGLKGKGYHFNYKFYFKLHFIT